MTLTESRRSADVVIVTSHAPLSVRQSARMTPPFLLNQGWWGQAALLLWAIAACGRASGTSPDNESGSVVSSSAGTGTTGVGAGTQSPSNGGAGSGATGTSLQDPGARAPSCAPRGPGMTSCGACNESCCTSLEVAGGTYYRTYDPPGPNLTVILAPDGGPAGEADPATVSSFYFDKYPVTVGRFRQFVSAVLPSDGGVGWRPPAGSGKHVHVNGGRGLVDVSAPPDAGTVYESGWQPSVVSSAGAVGTHIHLFC